MSSEHMRPFLRDSCMLSPPVRTFLKAGFGGMSLLKKVGGPLLHERHGRGRPQDHRAGREGAARPP
eukprot:15463701-Alexandrium_andersonii.AAC.1